MSQTVNTFNAELNAIMSALAGPIGTANTELSDGTKRGLAILYSIQTYGVDMSRDRAKAAINIVNQRIALAKDAVNALEPIDFDAIWPEGIADTVSGVIAADEAAAAAASASASEEEEPSAEEEPA